MINTPVALALAHIDAHRIDLAVAVLNAAADAGDVDALMQLAVWFLAGKHVPRDFVRARALIRRAVAIGHVDGALMEIALTANGAGSPANWAKARRLLDIAADGDPVAAAQQSLLNRMRVCVDGTPIAPHIPNILCSTPRVVSISGFLTPDECAHVASTGAKLLEPSQVIDPVTGQWAPHPIRNSDSAAIGPAREDLVVRAINLRIAAVSGFPVTHGEPLTILRYAPGQEYRPHLDTITGTANQRVRTVLIYLNQGFRGGETHFPLLNIKFVARGGDALIFDTLVADGSPDPRARHAGLPVIEGVKWIASRWIRADPIDPWTLVS